MQRFVFSRAVSSQNNLQPYKKSHFPMKRSLEITRSKKPPVPTKDNCPMYKQISVFANEVEGQSNCLSDHSSDSLAISNLSSGKRRARFSQLCCSSCFNSSKPAFDDGNQPFNHSSAGYALRKQGDFEGAVREYTRAIEIDKN